MAFNSFKIDSPFAQIEGNSVLCKLCNSHVKSAKVWTAHVNGKQHRQNLLELKARKLNKEPINKTSLKRSSGNLEIESVVKKSKKITDNEKDVHKPVLPEDFFDDKSIVKNVTFSKIDENLKTSNTSVGFDEKPSSSVNTSTKSGSESTNGNKMITTNESNATSLPEGFFDDKKLDAKARNVELKDPLDDEWLKFQKEIQQAQTATDAIVEEDEEKLNLERTLDEIEEEMRGWKKINELEKKVEKIVPATITKRNSSEKLVAESGDLVDEDDLPEDITLEEMTDWRSKQLWK